VLEALVTRSRDPADATSEMSAAAHQGEEASVGYVDHDDGRCCPIRSRDAVVGRFDATGGEATDVDGYPTRSGAISVALRQSHDGGGGGNQYRQDDCSDKDTRPHVVSFAPQMSGARIGISIQRHAYLPICAPGGSRYHA
jgi:hypothetical protein